jgi:hypothetical protein
MVQYKLRVFTLIFSSSLTHSLLRSEIYVILGVLGLNFEAHLLKEGIFGFLLAFLAYFLIEGVTIRVCYVIS